MELNVNWLEGLSPGGFGGRPEVQQGWRATPRRTPPGYPLPGGVHTPASPPGRQSAACWSIKHQMGQRTALVQRVHRYIPVGGQEIKPRKYRDGVNPGGDIHQEGLEPPYGASLRRKGTPVLLDDS